MCIYGFASSCRVIFVTCDFLGTRVRGSEGRYMSSSSSLLLFFESEKCAPVIGVCDCLLFGVDGVEYYI